MKERDQKIKVVFISGFITPHNWISYPVELIPPNITMIPVFPSPGTFQIVNLIITNMFK